MKQENLANKHLTYENRKYLEIGLNNGRNFNDIAKELNKSRTTIIREIKRNIFKKVPSSFNNSTNLCKYKFECKRFDCNDTMECYVENKCLNLLKTPYVCNSCDEKYGCRKVKYYYYASFADKEYRARLSDSRIGINLSKEEVYELDKLIAPLIKEKNQSISHIYANHPDEIWFSRSSMYKYIDLGVFSFRNIDLPRKVTYKKRKDTNKNKIRRETAIRQGRTYEDFKTYIEKHPDAHIVEMDTVEGTKGGKVFLTLLFKQSKFMLIFLLEEKSMEWVTKTFKYIQKTLGKEVYKKVFEVVLTDNGSEFFAPLDIERYIDTDEIVSHLFYCDPSASWQKGAIEKNHEFIRYVLPKGTPFDDLNQDKVNILASNINSTSRDILNGKAPHDAVQLILNEEIIQRLGIIKINPNEVNLSPNLLKGGDK